jgi:hypothetical protein
MAAVQGSTVNEADDEVASDHDTDSEDEKPVAKAPVAKAPETRAEKLDRLAREYEEAQAAAKEAAENGEGCLLCSS